MTKLPVRQAWILGTRVDDVTYEEAEALIADFMETGCPHQVVTSNPEFVMMAQRDAEFAGIINGAALVIPDGVGLLWASRLLGSPLREHVRGTDLVERLMGRAARAGYRVFLLGGAEGVAQMAAQRLRERHPALMVAGTYGGLPDPIYDAMTAEIIREARPVHLLLVAYGAPAQEKWIARNLPRLDVPVAMGVGGVLDFLSGRVKRAPGWVRRLEMEWLYRLVCQPWRWRRQLALPHFVLRVLAAKSRAAYRR